MLAGILYERRHTYEIKEFGGLAHVMPVYATIFLIVTLSSLGLPLMNNFPGEFLALSGAFQARPLWAVFGAIGVILGAAYLLWLYQRVFLGPAASEANRHLADLNRREAWQFAPLIFLIFWIGIYPKPLLSYIQPQTNVVVAQVQPDFFKAPPLTEKVAEERTPAANESTPAAETK